MEYDYQSNSRNIQNTVASVEDMADYEIYGHIDTSEICR